MIYSNEVQSNSKLFVVVSGAGPAGLSCALEAIKNGNRVRVLEEGGPESKGRPQSVILIPNTVRFLKKHGIYQTLLENKLIYPAKEGQCTVRLVDLEKTMREAVESHGVKIEYNAAITKIFKDQVTDKATLTLNNTSCVESVDLLINAEGHHSKTNSFFENHRVEVYDKQPILVSILKDDRPPIEDIKSFVIYSSKTARNVAMTIYYHVIYLFRAIFWNEHFLDSKRQIAAAVTLRTPGQHHVGFGFSKGLSEKLISLSENVKSGLAKQEELDQLIEYWTHVALAEVNCFALITYIASFFGIKETMFVAAPYYPLSSHSIAYIQSDYVEKPSIQVGKTSILMTGDALATVDPTTGPGCNVAIQQAMSVQAVIHSLEQKIPLKNALSHYDKVSRKTIKEMHDKALEFRELCRPDTLPEFENKGVGVHRHHLQTMINHPHLFQDEKEIKQIAKIFEKALTVEQRHIFSTIEHLCDDHEKMIELFKGGNIRLEDDGHFFERWKALKNRIKTRKSSHNHRKGEAKATHNKLCGELLFWKDKDTGHTHVQLEKNLVSLSNPIGSILHLKDYLIYKATGYQVGPFGMSVYSDKNPISVERDRCRVIQSHIESLEKSSKV